MNSAVRLLTLSLLVITISSASLNLAHAGRITDVVSFIYGQPMKTVFDMGFRNTDGSFIPNAKAVWYVWNSSSFPAQSITNLIILTHTGNYSVNGHVVINVMSVTDRTNSTGFATLVYNMPNGCAPYLYRVNGAPYFSINHLEAVGLCA